MLRWESRLVFQLRRKPSDDLRRTVRNVWKWASFSSFWQGLELDHMNSLVVLHVNLLTERFPSFSCELRRPFGFLEECLGDPSSHFLMIHIVLSNLYGKQITSVRAIQVSYASVYVPEVHRYFQSLVAFMARTTIISARRKPSRGRSRSPSDRLYFMKAVRVSERQHFTSIEVLGCPGSLH